MGHAMRLIAAASSTEVSVDFPRLWSFRVVAEHDDGPSGQAAARMYSQLITFCEDHSVHGRMATAPLDIKFVVQQ